MKLILIDGGPASGKNTLGNLLVGKFREIGDKAILLDLDVYVEEFNPQWIWDNEQQKEKDQFNARINLAKEINKYLKDNFTVIVIGERLLTKENIEKFVSRLEITCPTYLYHLSIPLALREKRLNQRGHSPLIDLPKDQKDRNAVKEWPGYVYENVNSPESDSQNLMSLIQEGKGLVRP